MESIKDFRNLSKGNVDIAGGKGASLGEMTQAGIPIPKGFVILSDAFEKFINETDLNVEIDAVLDTVNTEEVHTVDEASDKIRAMILSQDIPKDLSKKILEQFSRLKTKFVAVRSSATSEDSASAAWAGQLETYLNTTKKTLLENVKKCWASLFTPRAIFYRFEQKLHKKKISVAVVVQKMIDSEEAGIAFSVHPVTQDKNQLIIEAGFGLGEAIVSGQITPDSYVIDKQDWHIIDINVDTQPKGLYRKKDGGNEWRELGEKGKKQVLSDKEIIELAKLIVKIEKHYKFPVDVEWAKEKGKFYITQSRPITTLQPKEKVREKEDYYALLGKWAISKEIQYLFMTKGYREKFNNIFGMKYPSLIAKFEGKECSVFINEKERNKFKKELLKKTSESYLSNLLNKLKKSLQHVKTVGDLEILAAFNNWANEASFGLEVELYNSLPIKERNKFFEESTRPEWERIFSKKRSPLKNKKLDLIAQFLSFGAAIKQLTEKQIVNGVKNLKKKIKEEIGSLYKDNIWISDEKGLRKYSNEILLVEELVKEKELLQGLSANLGKVKGTALVATSLKEAKEIKEREILITITTDVNYEPYMKKASAFITEIGGITCHSAIIAREQEKPCIVSVKGVTKIIRTGDLIEIDANKGVVRILKKND